MKLKKILVLATAVLSLQYNYAQVSASRTPVFTGSDDVTAVKQKKASLSVHVNTSGASVYLDGSYRGTAPVCITEIEPGNHTLRIQKPHYETRTISINLRPGQTHDIYADLEKISGFLYVQTSPSGADIYVDGGRVLSSSSAIELDEGFHRISAEKFGYKKENSTITIIRGMTRTVSLTLQKAEFEITSVTASKKKFNPRNAGGLGSIDINFSVTAPETGTLYITDESGSILSSSEYTFTTWNGTYSWDGTDKDGYIAPDGTYKAVLCAGKKEVVASFSIDSSITYPQLSITSFGSGIAGLPVPKNNPSGSFTMEFGAGVCFAPLSEKTFAGAPYKISLAFTAADFLELSGNFTGFFAGSDKFSASGAAKFAWSSLVTDKTSLKYGISAAFESTAKFFPEEKCPDDGSGISFCGMMGTESDGTFAGLSSQYTFYTGTEEFAHLWKNGITVLKTTDFFSAGAYAAITSFPKENIWFDHADAGIQACIYLGSTRAYLILQTGCTWFPEAGIYLNANAAVSLTF